MTDTHLTALWTQTLNAEVLRVTDATGYQPKVWRSAGRPTKDKPRGEDIEWWEQSGAEQLGTYQAWLDSTDWRFAVYDGVPAIEFPVECAFGDVTVRGFIDAVFVTPDGEVVIVDYKSGSRTPDSFAQLSLYSACLGQMGYPIPTLGSYWMTRKGTMTEPTDLQRMDAQYWTNIVRQFKTAVDADIFLPNVGSHCFSCGVRDACYAAGGIDSYKYDPLHPAYQEKS